MPETDRIPTTPAHRLPPPTSSRPPATPPVALPGPVPAKPSRRGVLASAAGLLALGMAHQAGAETVTVAGPDAELIATCAEHVGNLDAYNREGGMSDEWDDSLWTAYERTRDAISAAKPQTIEGVAAKARAAKAEAGSRGDPEGSPAAAWSWHVVQDLLRLRGEA